jgi:N utilization substance protein B
LAVYEIMVERDLDIATILDEAVRLAKDFSGNESGRFVNGVLAKVISIHPDREVLAQSVWKTITPEDDSEPGH